MPEINALSLNGARIITAANQARNANSTMHLFKQGFAPTPASTLADFQANECDYDGYAAKTIAAWGDPVLAGQAWATFAPTQTFRWVLATEAVGNMVGGYWIQTAGGELMTYTVIDPAQPLQGPGQAFIKTPIMITPAG